jgi:hypothetical protein
MWVIGAREGEKACSSSDGRANNSCCTRLRLGMIGQPHQEANPPVTQSRCDRGTRESWWRFNPTPATTTALNYSTQTGYTTGKPTSDREQVAWCNRGTRELAAWVLEAVQPNPATAGCMHAALNYSTQARQVRKGDR